MHSALQYRTRWQPLHSRSLTPGWVAAVLPHAAQQAGGSAAGCVPLGTQGAAAALAVLEDTTCSTDDNDAMAFGK